jgi:hypothetical protein
MQSQGYPGLWELLFWIFAGSGLVGLPPGERDPALLNVAPPESVLYFEWAARGPGQPGATGIEGFATDPEILQLTQWIDQQLAKQAPPFMFDEDEEIPFYEHLLEKLTSVVPPLVRSLTAHPGSVFVSFHPIPDNQADPVGLARIAATIRAGIMVRSDTETDRLWKQLNQTLAAIFDFHEEEGGRTQSIPLPIPGLTLVAHRNDSRILIAFGAGTLDLMTDGLSGRKPGMESNLRFQTAVKQVAVERFSSVGWIDTKGILTNLTKSLGPLGLVIRPMAAMVGVDAVDHLVQSSGLEQDVLTQRTFIATAGRLDGALVLAAGPPIQPQQFAHIPADADLVLATSISFTRLFKESRQMIAKTQPLAVRIFDETVTELQSELELQILEDVFPAFGDVVMAFDSPSLGGMIATSLMLSVEIQDVKKATRVFEQLMRLTEQSLVEDSPDLDFEQPHSLKQQPFFGHTIFYIPFSEEDSHLGLSITPTFCLTDHHLLFAIHPQAMKAQLRSLQSKQPGFDQLARRKVAVPDGDCLLYAYLDGPRTSRLAAALLPYVGHDFLHWIGGDTEPLDLFAIPSTPAISSYFGDSTASITRQKEGLLIETRNAPPLIVALTFLSFYRQDQTLDLELLAARRRDRTNSTNPFQSKLARKQVAPAAAKYPDGKHSTAKTELTFSQQLAPLLRKAFSADAPRQRPPDSTISPGQEKSDP